VDTRGQEELLILNINSKGQLHVYGIEKDVESYIAGEAQASLFKAHRDHPDLKHGDELPTTVVIRADRGTPFNLLNKVIRACQDNGFRKFALKAMSREEAR
jgi:biopolymer transport protein ExbD